MKILVCGMPRSMTTWAFNVLRELIAAPGGQYLWIAPGSAEERAFVQSDGLVLAKCHHFDRALAEAADLVVYSYRDLRAAAVSYHRKFGSPCTREQLDNWVEAERAWLPHADVVLRYEDVEREPAGGVGRLRAALDAADAGLELVSAPDEQIVSRVENTFRTIETSPDVAYDASTMILPRHRTFQPAAQALPEMERSLYQRVEKDFAHWLLSHGYLQGGDYGQEVEYRIASLILGSFEKPVVVDVGMERGSFSALAVAAGSPRVIGFEPLPRHLDALARRFPADGPVRVHGLAISDRSGSAKLHVATNREGQELDYHHTLSDIGDSATVVRTRRELEVQVASLADLAQRGVLPATLDFLKVDTDGHDLSVLRGLGTLRPRVVLAEYWDTLPESSGNNPYALRDLAAWAREHGYVRMLVVRRHGRLELVQPEAPWTIAGDWGNVFFFAGAADFEALRAPIERIACESYEKACAYVSTLMKETEAKEAEIRRLDAAVRELRAGVAADNGGLHRQLQEKEHVIQDLAARLAQREPDAVRAQEAVWRQAAQELHRALDQLQAQQQLLERSLQEKEAVIRTLQGVVETDEARRDAGPAATAAPAAAIQPAAGDDLLRALREKEKVIQELNKALAAYRAAFSVAHHVLRPLNAVAARARSWRVRMGRLMLPRLGILNQHEPIEMRLPASYARPIALAHAPKISIVTPSFRQARFIERTIRSVLSQDYPALEYHVQDGASDDGTPAILERYASRLAGWQSVPDSGQTEAINRGFARTGGEIMAWLNSDDILLPGALAYVADYFDRHPEVDVVYGHRILIDEDDREIGRWVLPPHNDDMLSWADYVPQETLFWRRSIWEKAGARVDESFRFAMDWDLLVRFRAAGARIVRLPRFLGGFRIHAHQKTSAVITDVGFREMDRIRERVLGRVPSREEVRNALVPYLLRHVMSDLAWRASNRLTAKRPAASFA